MQENKLAVIGSGQMGQALARSFVNGFLSPEKLFIFDIDEQKAIDASSEIGCSVIRLSEIEKINECNFVLLAVKPQVIVSAVKGIVDHINSDTLVISIAAGITIKILRSCGLNNNPIARVMPNTPAQVGAAVSGIAFDKTSKAQNSWVIDLFSASGLAVEVPEHQLDAVTGVSGSGPAYMMMIIEAMADAGVYLGLARTQAVQMAAMTMYGSAKMLLETGLHPAQLKDQVCSPGGTTISAVVSLEKNGLRNAMIEAVAAAAGKAKLLADSEENDIV